MLNTLSEAEPTSAEKAVDFLEAIAGRAPLSFARISPSDGRTQFHTINLPWNRKALVDWIERDTGRFNLYFRLNAPRPEVGGATPKASVKEADIAEIRGVAVDLDPRDGHDFAAERARLDHIAKEWAAKGELAPTWIVDSGNGLQMAWLFPEPLPATPENAADIKAQAKAIGEALGSDPIHDLGRLLRIPFTVNLPNAKKRERGRMQRPTGLLHFAQGRRHTLPSLRRIAEPVDAEPGKAAPLPEIDYSAVLDALGDPAALPEHLRPIGEALAVRFAADVEAPTDRSALDFAIAAEAVSLFGVTDPGELAAVVFAVSPAKLEEKEAAGNGEDYAERTVRAVLAKARPHFDVIEGDLPQARERAPAQETPPPVIAPTPFIWRDPATIPPRRWLYGHHLIAGFVSLTVSPGGLGKSSNAIVEALAMATGRPLLGERVPKPLRVWYWNGEDPREEVERRVAAAMTHYEIDPAQLGGRLFIDSGRDLPIELARSDRNGTRVARPQVEAMKAALRQSEVDVLIVDPFVTCHSVSENDNGAINAVASAWREIAGADGRTVELVHHSNKGALNNSGEAGVEQSRGASALVDGVRSARFLAPMTKSDAQKAGVPQGAGVFRIDMGKANLAPKPERAMWRRMVGVPLGNGSELYPAGDAVGVATEWQWPDALDGVDATVLPAVLEALGSGEWRESDQSPDWAGFAVAEALKLDAGPRKKAERSDAQHAARAKVKGLLATWLGCGALRVEKRHVPKDGREAPFIVPGDPDTGAVSALPHRLVR